MPKVKEPKPVDAQNDVQDDIKKKDPVPARKYHRKPPDETPPGRIEQALRAYRNAYRKTDVTMARAAAEESEEARKQLGCTDDQDRQDELMAHIRRCENRKKRIFNRSVDARKLQLEALLILRDMVHEQIDAIDPKE